MHASRAFTKDRYTKSSNVQWVLVTQHLYYFSCSTLLPAGTVNVDCYWVNELDCPLPDMCHLASGKGAKIGQEIYEIKSGEY